MFLPINSLRFLYISYRLSRHTNLRIILFLTFFVSGSLCAVEISITPCLLMDQSENIKRNEISQVLQCLTLYMPPYVCLSVLFVANLTANYCRIYYPILNWQLQHCTCKELRANFAEKRRNFGSSVVLESARFRELGDGAKRKFAGLWYENLHHKNEISFWLNELSFD